MLPFRKILYPVDYSEPCKALIPYVRDFMARFQAQLTLVHAYGAEALAFSDLPLTDIELPDDVKKIEESRLEAFAAEHFPGADTLRVVRLGDPGMVIDETVRHEGADLVMLGTRGLGPVRRFLLGSVCTKVLHDVNAAVWAGTNAEVLDHASALPYKSILCAVESTSAEGEAVLVGAAAMAKAYGAQLVLATAVETPPASLEIDFAPIKKDLLDAADVTLNEMKAKLGITAPHVLLDGPVAEGIREEALRVKADLIVTGRGHAQGGMSRLWSHLYPIIRQAPCPVLSV